MAPRGTDANGISVPESNAATYSGEVSIGPDLNESRTPLDKKLYRQILLPNGLRAVLIQDTIAIHESHASGGIPSEGYESDEESDEEEEGCTNPEDPRRSGKRHRHSSGSDDDESKSEEGDSEAGIRDAAASILVGAGSMYDPEECQGLAHFLEHLLFMGSEKYPGENEYEAFVAKHGGTDNAWTEWEYTTYTLSIPQEYLWPALDRLAQFFVAPLLLESAVERELLSIESEFQLNRNSDSCRWQQLLCATSDPSHPMAKFSWGNLKSLKNIPSKAGVDPLAELRTFYDRYYYAANMRVAVIGAYSLDEMESKIVSLFSSVPALPRAQPPPNFALPVDPNEIASWDCKYNSPISNVGSPLRAEKSLQKIFRIVPVKERHSLTITWPIPSQIDHWSTKPADYIAHLIGHEASGSLLSYFRKQSWAIGCVAGVGDEGSERASSHALFAATFTLSELGLREWRKMVDAVYQYIGMLRSRELPAWIYEELKMIQESSYRYAEEGSPDDVVEDIMEQMAPHHKMPPERLLDGNHLLFGFDGDAVKNLLDNYITPYNARIDLTSSSFGKPTDFEADDTDDSTETIIGYLKVSEEGENFSLDLAGPPQVEPMFGTFFWCTVTPKGLMDHWSSLALPQEPTLPVSLPPQNPFVPTEFDIKPLPDEDALHPLLNSSLKLCVSVGKTKQWFPATAIQYNRKKNALLLSYEDEDEQWHVLDHKESELSSDKFMPDFEGSFDRKAVKFRIVALAQPGMGAVRRFGDDSDFDVEEGKGFPPIPPALPASRLPKQVANTNVLKMWHLQDRSFHRPTAELRLQIMCANANITPKHRACADLLVALCADACLETTYLASVCELGSSLDATDVGFVFRFHGFDSKLLDLFKSYTSLFLSFRGRSDTLPDVTDETRFDSCVEFLRRSLKNAGVAAEKLATSIRLQAIRPTIWSAHSMLRALEGIDVAGFVKVTAEILDKFAVEALLHGNVNSADANEAKKMILDMVESSGGCGLPRKKYPSQPVLKIPFVEKPTLITVPSKDVKEPNTAVEVYVQVGKDNERERVLIDLLIHMMDEPIYDQIRTKDQFGYDVHCDVRWSFGIMGMMFKVVTNVKSAEDVVARIDLFLTDFRKELEEMTADDFLHHLVGLATQKLDMFNSLREETDSYWDELRDGRFEWTSWRNEAISLRTVTKDEVIKVFDKWLDPAISRRILAVQVIGNGDNSSSVDRPDVEVDRVGEYYDSQVEEFHKLCKNQTWGRVNSKLF